MSLRILVVSSHPAIDAEWRVARVVPEEKNLISEERRWPGGKGINVARWLAWLGAKPVVLLPLGGDTGDELSRGLRAEKIDYCGVPIAEPNRVNVVVSQDQGPQYRFNAIRPRFSARETQAFRNAFCKLAQAADLIIISGTLAPGLPRTFYRTLISEAKKCGCPALLDCDGQAFQSGLEARPLLVKPNEFELEQWAGKPFQSEADLRAAALELSGKTQGWVLVSRGASGALLVNAAENFILQQPAKKVKVRNTVGAGDAMVAAAGWAIAKKLPPNQWLAASLTTAGVLVALPPGELPSGTTKRPRVK